MDMISFGPDISYPHSPDEQMSVSSVQSFYKLLLALLKRLAGK
jgi:dipeptidase D